ncbi:MAG: hypothetical protein KJO16_03340 [Muriicola sp.]|nr:hypothetical protein [Muriicola sp.]NNK12394.1 hypothetical protein [Flavobacteriaceae bacterium]
MAVSTLVSKRTIRRSAILSVLILSSCNLKNSHVPETPQPFTTPLGRVYERNKASGKALQDYQEARSAYLNDTTDVDLLIWYGRRTAYLGNYEDAIAIFTSGIQRFPEDARLYRHRGHRYISLRQFDKAIADLEQGAQLIKGTANEIEPDGIPNAMNIPVSTLHGNIWYHLGLAYYLKQDYDNAYRAYLNCKESGENPDNLVSSTHWLYMIQRKLKNYSAADSLLLPITPELKVIENSSYHNLCLFYKGLITEKDLLPEGEASAASDAVAYGLANWYFTEEDSKKIKEGLLLMTKIVEGENWSSFGYIAAETDLSNIPFRKGPDPISE